jgi:hypothetical protein
MEKLLEQYILRISPTLKHNLLKLTDVETKSMTDELRIVMARHVHNCAAVFDYSLYTDEQKEK